jgi:hypothetical protein
MNSARLCRNAALLIVFSTLPAFAQRVELGGDILVGFPQNEFKRNVDAVGGGLSAQIGYAPEESPFLLGFRLLFLNYGSEKRSDVILGQFSPIDADITTSNNILMGQLLARLGAHVGRFRPFVEGFLGYNYLFTETTVRGENTGETITSETNFDDGAFGYGGGGGFQFSITGENLDDPAAPPDGLSLSLSARYMFGGKATYLKKGSIRQENEKLVYYTHESTTDLLMIALGVTYYF